MSSKAALQAPCTCTWDPGDGYMQPPTPKDICDVCIGGMEHAHRTAYAMNQYRMNLSDEDRNAIRRAMNATGLHPYTGLTEQQQDREVRETMDERVGSNV